jgi:hypothetical protein
MHDDSAVVEKDVALIREMEKNNELFEYEHNKILFKSASRVFDDENPATMTTSTRTDIY